MTDERRGVVESIEPDPELQLSFTVRDRRVTDAEIDQLRELARSGTVEAASRRSYAVNRVAELYEHPAVVVEDPPGRYRLSPDITAFAEAVIERELSRRQDDRIRHALLSTLASLPADHLRVIQQLCAPPRPLESAVQGVEVDDPDGFVSAAHTAARSHGISEPIVEASARTVRATIPPDRLDEGTLRRLARQGDLINEQASRSGFTASTGLPELVRRNDSNQWSLPAIIRHQLRQVWRP
jgi:hypothetical protein